VVIRLLWEGGFKNHHGRHTPWKPRACTRCPSSRRRSSYRDSGPKRSRLQVASATDTSPSAPTERQCSATREHGGSGPITGGLKVCWGEDRDECVRTTHRLWPNEALSGELAQVLPSPRHFEQATQLVTEQHIASSLPCGPDPANTPLRSRPTWMPASTRSTSARSGRARRLHRHLRTRDPAALLSLSRGWRQVGDGAYSVSVA
jgi:hypothetical protein